MHNARTHGDETPALNISPTETSEEENTSRDMAEVTGQEEQNDYCEPGLNCIRRDHTELHKLQESTRMKSPVNPQISHTPH